MSTPKPARAEQNAKKCRYEQAKDNKRSFENGRVLEGENGRKQRQNAGNAEFLKRVQNGGKS